MKLKTGKNWGRNGLIFRKIESSFVSFVDLKSTYFKQLNLRFCLITKNVLECYKNANSCPPGL